MGVAAGDTVRFWNLFILELRYLLEDPGAPDLEGEVFAAAARAVGGDHVCPTAACALTSACASASKALAERVRADLSREEIVALGRWCNDVMDALMRTSLQALQQVREDGVAEA